MLNKIKSLINKFTKDMNNENSDFFIDSEIETYANGYLQGLILLREKGIPIIWKNTINKEINRFSKAFMIDGTEEEQNNEDETFHKGYFDGLNKMYKLYSNKNKIIQIEQLKERIYI